MITLEQARGALQEVVAEQGGSYVYPIADRPYGHCRYVWNGAPDCGAGRALHRLGVSIQTLGEIEGRSVLVLEGSSLTHDAAWYLRDFQRRQDLGYPWSEALVFAESAVTNGEISE